MLFLSCLMLVLALSQASGSITYGGSYKFISSLELSDNASNPVGYQLKASAKIQQVHPNLLLVELKGIKLHFATRKLHNNNNFKQSKSELDSVENEAFFIGIHDGKVSKVYVSSKEEQSNIGIKKGFSSLFQFQSKSSESRDETDTSGTCKVKYKLLENSLIKKTKDECQPNKKKTLWGGQIISRRDSEIRLEDGKKLLSVVQNEVHTVKPSLAEFDVIVSSKLELIYENDYAPKNVYENQNIEMIISNAGKDFGITYVSYDLNAESIIKESKLAQKFSDVVKNNIKALNKEGFGTKTSAKAALEVIYALKQESYDDIYKTLTSKNNKNIRGQLIDLLGAVQTKESHKAAKQFLNFTSNNYDLDLCERYLWALSISPVHNEDIIEDLLEFSKGKFIDLKLYETLVQTISSMIKKYTEDTKNIELQKEVLLTFTSNLKKCKKDDEVCLRTYLKSFKNIGSPEVLKIIPEYVRSESPGIGMRAMKVIQNLDKSYWNEEVLNISEGILFTNGTYDSTSKTIALDILLESTPSDFVLAKILNILKHQEHSKELKQYLLERLTQISEKNKSFKSQVNSIVLSEGLNNYNDLVPGGLSTAFERRFMKSGFLSTTQEIMFGLLKQGHVHVNLEDGNNIHKVFTLGLFSKGLSSFVSDGEEETVDNDVASAGLELTVLGVEFRPFIFFEGSGELMGHVFSGTASDLTPAYQALLLLEDDTVRIPLAIGQIAEIKLSSVASVDLSGKIEISIWSRTADSLVQNRAGILKKVGVRINSPFVVCEIEHDITVEPQLSLTSYTEFSGKMALCLQLKQPDTRIEYTSNKYESFIGTKQKVKRAIVTKRNVPGKSYVLNTKNNEMCRIING